MLRRIMFLMIAASLIGGFTLAASASERDKDYVWEVECKCTWVLELEYSHEDPKGLCYSGKTFKKSIEAPDKHKKITLEADLRGNHGYKSGTKDTEKSFDGKFTVKHEIDDYCYFKSKVSKKDHKDHDRED